MPHLEAFLSHIDVWLEEKTFRKQTVEKYYLVLLVWMSNGYYDLGDLIRKIELLGQAIPILQKHFGPDHHEVATLLVNLGIAYNALNNPQKAKSCLNGLYLSLKDIIALIIFKLQNCWQT